MDLLWIAWWFACALWARRYFPTFVSLILDRPEPAAAVSVLAKTVRDTGGIRHPGGAVFQHARWQVGT